MKPILFNTPMAKAIIEGKKTATRRIEKDIIAKDFVKALCETKKSVAETLAGLGFSAPYKPGDVLYVRESFRVAEIWSGAHDGCKVEYKAGGDVVFEEIVGKESKKWKPSIHQPKKLARTFLKVTSVYPDMLQDISEEQAEKEGCGRYSILVNAKTGKRKAVADDVGGSFVLGFAEAWNKTVKKKDRPTRSWEANPLVWVIEFEKVDADEALAWDRLSEMTFEQKLELYDKWNDGNRCSVCIFTSCNGMTSGPNGPIYPKCSDHNPDDLVVPEKLDDECFQILLDELSDESEGE